MRPGSARAGEVDTDVLHRQIKRLKATSGAAVAERLDQAEQQIEALTRTVKGLQMHLGQVRAELKKLKAR